MNILTGKGARTLNKTKKKENKEQRHINVQPNPVRSYTPHEIHLNQTWDPSEEVAKAAVARPEPTHGCRHGDVSGWRHCHQAILEVVGGAVSIQARMTEGEHSFPWCLRS
jgi:hypothetical protein